MTDRWERPIRRAVTPHGGEYIEYTADDGSRRVKMDDGGMVCDFCCAEPPTWEYPAGEMEILGHPAMDKSDDSWGACDACKEIIETGDVNALVERVMREQEAQVQELMGRDPNIGLSFTSAVQRELLRTNYLAFLRARTGPVIPWSPE